MMSGDEELVDFLGGLFDENENDEHNCYTQRSKEFIIHGEKKRLRLHEYVTVALFKDIETTLANVGAIDHVMGEGVLFKRTVSDLIEDGLFKILTFEDIAKWVLLKTWISTKNISLVDWLAFWKNIRFSKHRKHVNDAECATVFRFNTTCGNKKLSKSHKGVADAFHDSMHKFGLVATPHRGTGGLAEFAFPGCSSVSAARKKLCLLLHGEDRLEFCNDQISGKQINLSNVFLGADEPPLKKRCSEASRSQGGICEPSADNAEIQMPDEGPSADNAKTQMSDESEESAREHAENLLIALGEPVPPIETMNENLRKRYSNAFSVLRGKDAKEPIVFDLKQWLICLAMYLYMTLVEYGLSVTKRENVLQVISIVLAFIFFVVLTTNSGHKNLDFFLYVVGYPICIYAIGIPWHTGIISAVMTIQIIALEFNRSLHHLLGLIVIAFIVSIIFTGNQGIWFVDSWWLLLLRAAPTYCVLYSQRVNNADAAGTIAVSLWRDLPLLLLQICMIFGYVK